MRLWCNTLPLVERLELPLRGVALSFFIARSVGALLRRAAPGLERFAEQHAAACSECRRQRISFSERMADQGTAGAADRVADDPGRADTRAASKQRAGNDGKNETRCELHDECSSPSRLTRCSSAGATRFSAVLLPAGSNSRTRLPQMSPARRFSARMNIVLFNSPSEGRLALTTGVSGAAVLRMEGVPNVRDGDYGPADTVLVGATPAPAASFVYSWALDKFRSDRGIAAAQAYLRQWPEGPQVEPEDIQLDRAATDQLFQAADELNGDTATLEELTPKGLCELIHTMTDLLEVEQPLSAKALLLRYRIKLAVTLLYRFSKTSASQ